MVVPNINSILLVGQIPEQATIVTAADMNGAAPYTGETCIQANWTGISIGRLVGFSCASTTPANCLQTHKVNYSFLFLFLFLMNIQYNKLHFYIYSDKTQKIAIRIGPTTTNFALVDTATDPRVINNTWSKVHLSFVT